jgi:glycosyltransferase involved in cell wall biosynthesis
LRQCNLASAEAEEALASNTPVIASNRGSMPELIDHG